MMLEQIIDRIYGVPPDAVVLEQAAANTVVARICPAGTPASRAKVHAPMKPRTLVTRLLPPPVMDRLRRETELALEPEDRVLPPAEIIAAVAACDALLQSLPADRSAWPAAVASLRFRHSAGAWSPCRMAGKSMWKNRYPQGFPSITWVKSAYPLLVSTEMMAIRCGRRGKAVCLLRS